MAAPANFFQLTAALLRLPAVLTMLADGFVQICFGLADVIATVGAGGCCRSGQ